MSRIDQALNRWEAGRSAQSGESSDAASAAASALNLYPQEQPERDTKESAVNLAAPTVLVDAPPETPADSRRHQSTRSGRPRYAADVQARLVTAQANTVSLEQYRRLAAILHDVQVEKQLKTVMITSAVPQEGKTLTIMNLALTLSESYGRRVLMIDADLRWPSLHAVLGIPNGRGLSEALREGRRGLPIIDVSPRLSILTAGHPGPTPLAGLSSARMGEVIDECAARFEWVLIDTSPVGVLPDASVLGRLVGGVLFVIRAGSTPAKVVERAIAEIGSDAIIGTVLNQVEERRIPAAGYYSQYGSAQARR
jgi:capsular exopolysaccharide synthesis family protein